MNAIKNSYSLSLPSDIVLKYIALYKRVGSSLKDIDNLNAKYSVYHDITRKEDLRSLFSTYFSGYKITDQRLGYIIDRSNHVSPKNNDEIYLSNLVNVFDLIYSSSKFTLSENEIQDLEQTLSKGVSRSYGFKRPNKDERSYRDRLEEICKIYHEVYNSHKVEATYLNISFLVDFLKLSPFYQYNEMIGMIIFYVLMLKSEIKCFAYISFFKKFMERKKEFDEALNKSFYMYEDSMSNLSPLTRFFLDIMIDSYNDLHDLSRTEEQDRALNKALTVVNVIYKLDDNFSKEDIRKRLPSVSDSTIDRVLKAMQDEGKIMTLGRGRGAKWLRLDDSYKESENIFKNLK